MAEHAHHWSGMDYIHPRLIVTRPEVAALLPEAVVRENNVLSQGVEGGVLTILISDPNDFDTMDKLRFILSSRCWPEIRFALSSRRGIQEAIAKVYGNHEL
jgi:type IV pilus assembly protein PilB